MKAVLTLKHTSMLHANIWLYPSFQTLLTLYVNTLKLTHLLFL
jgi:hypothetical protein